MHIYEYLPDMNIYEYDIYEYYIYSYRYKCISLNPKAVNVLKT